MTTDRKILRHCRMNYATDKDELYSKVSCIRHILGIKLTSYPINLYDYLSSVSSILLVRTVKFATPGLGGYTIKNCNQPSVIVLNSLQQGVDKNFALAHELIHFFCHEYANGGYYSAKNEVQANEGAAELLLPYKLFLPDVQSGIEYYGSLEDAILNTANAYKVAPDVAKYRYLNLKAEREQFFSGVPLDDIKIMKRSEWEALQE